VKESLLPATPFSIHFCKCHTLRQQLSKWYWYWHVDITWPDENWVTTEAHSAQLSWVESGALNALTIRLNSTQLKTFKTGKKTRQPVELSWVGSSERSERPIRLNLTSWVELSWVGRSEIWIGLYSVGLSVRPLVKRVNYNKKYFTPYERSLCLVFWEEECLVTATLSTWNLGSTGPCGSKIADFQPIIACSVSPSEKDKLTLIGSPPRAYQWA